MLRSPAAGVCRVDRHDRQLSSIYVRVDDVDGHYRRAVAAGAGILREPADQDYGERNYGATDLEGQQWWFAQAQ